MVDVNLEAKVESKPEMKQAIKIDESSLKAGDRKILEEFKEKNEIKVPKETVEGWFKRIGEIDIDNLPSFIEELINIDHDYYSTVSAATCIALASVKAFNKRNIFKDKNQGLKIANSIYASMTGIGDDPFRVFEFYSILDPNCDGQITSIPKHIFAAIRTKASNLLKEHSEAPEYLKKRWKQVEKGKLPDGWVVRDLNLD